MRTPFSSLFGLIYDVVFPGKPLGVLGPVTLCVVAAFVTPLVAPRRNKRTTLLATTLVVALARVPLTINSPAVRLWCSILIIAAAGIYATTLLRLRSPHGGSRAGSAMKARVAPRTVCAVYSKVVQSG